MSHHVVQISRIPVAVQNNHIDSGAVQPVLSATIGRPERKRIVICQNENEDPVIRKSVSKVSL